MLCISMKPGDYFTVGDSTVVQFDRLHGERVCLMIQAPREVPILRGEVLERHGGQKPSCVQEKPARYVRQLPWNRERSWPCKSSGRPWSAWMAAPRPSCSGKSWT